MATLTARRAHWDGPVDLGEGFRLYKPRMAACETVCWLSTHELGFELVVNINGQLQRSELCRSADEVLSKTEAWKMALLERGWRDVHRPD